MCKQKVFAPNQQSPMKRIILSAFPLLYITYRYHYFHHYCRFFLPQSGVLSALPYILLWAFGVLWGILMEKLSLAGVLSIKAIRRLSTAVGLLSFILILFFRFLFM